MKLFVAMPYANDFDPVYAAIKEASGSLGIEPVRVDEQHEPGPIIQQIMKEIGNADFVVAEVSNRNPNVYYEVGLAHCVRKPTMLVASRGAATNLPFDIRHNRVVVYDPNDLQSLREALNAHLSYFAAHFGTQKSTPDIESFFSVLADNKRDAKIVIQDFISREAKDFNLIDAKLIGSKYLLDRDSYLIEIGDAFRERVVIEVDLNGVVRQRRRLVP